MKDCANEFGFEFKASIPIKEQLLSEGEKMRLNNIKLQFL